MGYGYDAICKGCGANFEVNEGSEMVAMPFHCERCGRNVVEVRTRRPRWKRAGRPALRLRGGGILSRCAGPVCQVRIGGFRPRPRRNVDDLRLINTKRCEERAANLIAQTNRLG
jgi:DNA-directed RNA polymerase subunit RPC12/RpoP